MFDKPSHSKTTATGPVTVYFLDWLKTEVLKPKAEVRAAKLLERLIKAASPLVRLKTTPQSPPYHAEGAMVSDHVKRMLAGLEAFQQGASLATVEEFTREKDYLLELHALEETLKSQAAFLAAYAVCHDVAKADALSFEAPPGTRGEAEGFVSRPAHLATEPEKARYDKLRRAHDAAGQIQTFFDDYGIWVHYPEHGRRSASDEYATTREAVLGALDVPLSKAKLFTEVIRCHMDVIHGFNKGPDPVKYRALAAIAERAGLNTSVFLDVLPAAVFLDAILGSLVYVDKEYSADVHILFNVFRSEREAMPERHAARVEALRRGRKQLIRDVLIQAKIDADTVFDLLKTPYGPVRGEVMARVHAVIRDPESKADFGEHTEELRNRARAAQQLLSQQHLTLE